MKAIVVLFLFSILVSCQSTYVDEQGNEYSSWTNLIDGGLDNFVQRGGKAVYELKDGVVIGKTRPKTPNTFLCTKKIYCDFELEFEFNVDPMLNSGVQIRSNVKKLDNGTDRVWGYQSEIDPSSRAWSAGIYEEAGRGWLNNLKENEAARKAFKQNDWNKVRILAIGDHIQTWINGVPAADLKDDKTASGFIALQVHGVRYDEEKLVQWRNLRVREITAKK